MPENKKKPLRIEFEDNALLLALCGHHDVHIKRIEEQLDVEIVLRGNLVAIFGAPEESERAKVVLEDLYKILESEGDVTADEVDAALRVSTGSAETKDDVRPSDIIGGKTAIRTPLKKIMPRSLQQHAYVNALQQNGLVFGVGPAGTGKTFLATAMAVHLLSNKLAKRIILTRPVVEAGENLGFLPGTLEEKIDPYLRPLFDALNDLLGPERTKEYLENGTIEIAPLAYMRGRTLNDCVMLLDEAQNTTTVQMRMFLTRMGEGSTMIVTGDPSQCDLRGKQTSGLREAISVLDGVKGVDIVKFTEADVVRHPLVKRIVQAYDQRDRQIDMNLDEDYTWHTEK